MKVGETQLNPERKSNTAIYKRGTSEPYNALILNEQAHVKNMPGRNRLEDNPSCKRKSHFIASSFCLAI